MGTFRSVLLMRISGGKLPSRSYSTIGFGLSMTLSRPGGQAFSYDVLQDFVQASLLI
jgi:hypothetical protein